MKVTSIKLSLLALITTFLFNVFILFDFNFLSFGSIYSFIYLCIIPGLLINQSLRIQKNSFFELITSSVGLSIAYLLLVGVTTNSLSFLLNLQQPLNTMNSLVVFDSYTA